MARMKLPPKSVSPMAADTVGEAPMAAPAAPMPMMPKAAPAQPAVQRGTHNPANLLPGHAFHGKRR